MDRLVEIDRRGVANEGLARRCPDQRSDAVAEPDRHVEPSGAVPAPDEVMAPFLFDGAVQNSCCGSRHRTERISVEIDDAFRKYKTVAERRGADRRSRRATHASRDVAMVDVMRASRSRADHASYHRARIARNRTSRLGNDGNCLFRFAREARFLLSSARKSRLTAKVHPFRLKASPAGILGRRHGAHAL